jgi:trimeric autotransporter adhesin
MQQLAVLRLLALVVLVAGISACGGDGNENQIGPPATVTVSPTTLSLNKGQTSAVFITVRDASDNINLSAPVTVQSSNTAVATVRAVTQSNGTIAGAVCAGTWNAAGTICEPGTVIGTANITATAGTITSSPVVVTTHERIARIDISPAAPACVSQGGTQQFTATVLDANNVDITATAGTVSWTSLDTTVATISTTGLVTARRPGSSLVAAAAGSVNSVTVPFITCPPASILIASQNVTPTETSFTLAAAGTKQLAATVVDTLGATIADAGLTFTSSNPGVANVSATGLVTAVAAGTARISAACVPSGCNSGVNQPLYSNLVTVTVSGTLSPRVYVTGTHSTTVVPIDPATNTAGTAINIPQIAVNGTNVRPVLNSALFSRDGSRLYFGSDVALLIFDTTTNQFTGAVPGTPGRVLAVSSTGRLAISDPSGTVVWTVDPVTGTALSTITVAAPTAADFTPDGSRLFITGASGVTVATGTTGNRTIAFPLAATDIAVLAQGTTAYVAGGSPAALDVMATCNNSVLTPVAGVAATTTRVESAADGTRIYAIDNAAIYEVAVTVTSVTCPPSVSNTATAVNFGAGTFTPRQLIVSQAGDAAFVLSNLASVLVYDATTDTPTTIALAGGGTSALSGGVLPDGSQVYVGVAGSNDVHRIDVVTGTDAQQIAVNLVKPDNTVQAPDIVVVKPR